MFQSIFLVSAGAAIGASLRWGLGLWLNSLFSSLAFGTLVANFIGCFLMGILVAAFWLFPQFSPEWRLFLVTGFLGALTTFSSFSGEVIELFFKEEWVNGLFVLVNHLVGCLIFTVLGIYFFRLISLLFHFR
ncbi:fluoride efflux transporter CrcB [Haemophilus parainfluenzae]|uniref:Fluoride-specific ion channel FluC n=1 Tax=Haemophilus parainfluenzae TaxID=729 RepID=A0A377JHU7_HAEPA|nr:fluoride efflux transporter CrcB [Haemophilus parainfluenzae]MBS6285718.1 fluoride efflux transporter CrcB [Haemophilus parainfluenzae]STP03886.1 inner membrane protein associated with chromosome condensation [Haemophilus parainfluenzae]